MEPVTNTGHRTGRGVLVILGVLVAGLAIGLGLLLTQGTNETPAAQLASVQTGCTQWLGTNPGEPGTANWCSKMASWMNRSGMDPQMMWGDANRMLSTCEQWMSASPPSGTTTTPYTWCSSMVSWMTSHIGTWSGQSNWGEWMSHGSMMGGSGP